MSTSSIPLLLTPRDQELLAMAYEFGGVTAQQLARRFFPSPAGQRACYRRIQLLLAHEYLRSSRLPSESGVGSGPLFLVPGRGARPVLGRMLGLAVGELRTLHEQVAPVFFHHHRALGDTRLAVLLATERLGVAQLVEWVPEHELKRQPLRLTDPRTLQPAPIVPDGSFILQRADGRAQSFFLEQDMGTIPPRRMRAKLRLYLTQGAQEPRTPAVLIVTATASRQAALARWTLEETAWLATERRITADPSRLFLTTIARVSEHTVLSEPIWQVIDGPSAFALLPTTPAQATAAGRPAVSLPPFPPSRALRPASS